MCDWRSWQFHFVSLIAFGTYLLAYTETAQRVITLVPIGLEAIWVFGLANFRGNYPPEEIWAVADVWTRYTLAMPGGLLAAIGLVAQQRAFRRSGLVRFGQDALWAAVAFAWYGVVGQFFVQNISITALEYHQSGTFHRSFWISGTTISAQEWRSLQPFL